MWEVKVIDNHSSSEMGTFGCEPDQIYRGSVIMYEDYTIKVLSVEINPDTGEDAAIVIEFI